MNKFNSSKTKTINIADLSYVNRDKGIGIELHENIFKIIYDHLINNFTNPSTSTTRFFPEVNYS